VAILLRRRPPSDRPVARSADGRVPGPRLPGQEEPARLPCSPPRLGRRLFDAFMGCRSPRRRGPRGPRKQHCRRGTSTATSAATHRRPGALEYLCEFEELLLNDGCTGVASSPPAGRSKCNSTHKCCSVRPKMKPFAGIEGMGVRRCEVLPRKRSEHLHYSTEEQADQFKNCVCGRVGDVDRVFRC